MNHLRPVTALLFALLLAISSGTMAVARGQATSVGTMVLCTGSGPASVPVDAEGKPTGPAHICPDCALSLFAAHAAPSPDPVRPVADAALAASAPVAQLLLRRHATLGLARGPPSLS